MENLILLGGVTGIFIFLFFIVKKAEIFFNQNYFIFPISSPPLRIGLENPALADTAENLLNHFANQHSECKWQFFCGTADEIIQELNENRLDCGFLSSDFPLIPLDYEEQPIKIIWKKYEYSQEMTLFREYLMQNFQENCQNI